MSTTPAPPTKGELTRQRVIERAAPVFNRRGYWGTSLRDVMEASGLEKGGIYNHFANKDELALAAFDHNVAVLATHIRAALAEHRNAVDRLHALVQAYRRFVRDPLPGGCPMLNAAVDTDDTHRVLRDRVRQAVADLHDGTVGRIVVRGLERGELRPDTNPDDVATVIVAGLEGALMLWQLYDDPSYVERTARHLDDYIDSLAPNQEGAP